MDFRPKSHALALEPRILFDGAAAAAADQKQADSPEAGIAPLAPVAALADPREAPVAASAAPRHLAVLDGRLQNRAQLLAALPGDVQALVIDAGDDALDAIAQTLSDLGEVDSIQIFSHGAAGQFALGDRSFTAAGVEQLGEAFAAWRGALSEGADIQLYGCSVGAGEAGRALIGALARWTHADVGASSDDTGSAARGGDWALEVSAGTIDQAIALSAVALNGFDFLLADASPTLGVSPAAIDALIGGPFSFSVSFTNASAAQPGFAPFIDLILPATGKDGAGAQPDDGITFVSATTLGQAVTAHLLSFDASGNASHPLAKDASGAAVLVSAAAFGAQAGDQLVVLQLPYSSVIDGQPDIPVVVTATLSALADTQGSPDLLIKARGGFQLGNDSADNAATDPSLLEATLHTVTVHPTAFRLTQSVSAPDGETATGPNFERTLTVTGTPADGQTLTNVSFTQSLPGTIRVTNIVPGAGGTVTSVTLANGAVLTDPAAIAALVGQDPYLSSYTVRYASVSAPTSVVVSFYVPELDAAGAPVLDPATGAPRTITLGAPAVGAQWLPLDPRDRSVPVTIAATADPASITAKPLTVRDSVAIATDTGAAGVSPGDTLEYRLEMNLSDYFALGRSLSGAGSLSLVDQLGDGQRLVGGSASLTIHTEGSSTTASLAPTAGAPGPGGTTLTFDLAQAIDAQNQMFDALIGDLRVDGVLEGATRAVLTYRATVEQAYTAVHTQSEINEGDSLGNHATLSGTILASPLTLAGTVQADATASSGIPTHTIQPSILTINGGAPPPGAELRPGDLVTFRLAYDLETGDYENLSFTAYLPLPVFQLGAITEGIGVNTWRVGSGHTSSDPDDAVVSVDAARNALVFDFGSHATGATAGSRVEVLFTLQVGNDPIPDQRPLAILTQSDQLTSIAHDRLVSTGVIDIASVAEPVLAIQHGVVALGAGSAGVVTGEGDVTGIDAGDVLRLATTIKNSGGLGAFDVVTTVTLPAGLSFDGGSLDDANVEVYRGNGAALTEGVDYQISGNAILFLDAGGSPSLLPGRAGTASDASGANVVVITYDVVADATVAASEDFETSAALTRYSSADGGPDFALSDAVDTATQAVAAPVITKVFADGTLSAGDSSASHTSGADLVIGEAMLFDLVVTLPEGVTQSLQVRDLIPAGLTLDLDYGGGDGYRIITEREDSGALDADFDGTLTIDGDSALGGDGNDLLITFDSARADDDNHADDNSFVIRVRLIASNVAANQAGAIRANGAQLAYSDPDGDPPGGGALERSVSLSGAAPAITIREPTLTITKTALTDGSAVGVDDEDIVTYTITIANHSGVDAFHVTLFDQFHDDVLEFDHDGLGLVDVDYDGGATSNGGGNGFDFNEDDGLLVSDADIDIPDGGSITLVVRGEVEADAASVPDIVNFAEVRWTSLENQDDNERTGEDGPLDGGSLNDYRASAAVIVPVASAATISHVGGLAGTPAPAPTNQPETVTVGELVYYRVAFLVPEGEVDDASIVVNLPAGLTLVEDGSSIAWVALVSDNDNLESDEIDHDAEVDDEITTFEQTLLAASLSNRATEQLDDHLVDSSDPRHIRFELGDLENDDADSGASDFEFIYLEFQARVSNTAGVVAGDSLAVGAEFYSGSTRLATTPNAVENVVESNLRDLQKIITAFDPRPNGNTGIATVTLDFSNTGNGIAYDAHLDDRMTGGSHYAVSAVVIDGTSFAPGSLPPGVSVSASGNGITADLAGVAIGASVQVVYTVQVPGHVPNNPADATLRWSSLPETYNGAFGATVGDDGDADGERDDSGNTTPPNTYLVTTSAGLGFISGRLWDDTGSPTASAVPDGIDTGLAGQTVTLTWGGADGDLATAADNQTFTATTDALGDYRFGALAAGTYRVDAPALITGYAFGADTDNPAARIDTDGGTLASVTISLGDAASSSANVGYVRDNDAPVNALPATQFIDEDSVLPIGGLSIADADAGSGNLSVTLSVLHGALGLNAAGVSVSGGALGSSSVTITGARSALNTALATLQYTPPANYSGNDTLSVVTSDLGNSGDRNGDGTPGEAADALTDSDALTIAINPVNDAPSAAADAAIAIEAGGRANAIAGLNPAGSVLANDVDVDIQTSGDVLSVTHIRLGSGGTNIPVSGNTQLVGAYGTLTINSAGTASYAVDNANAAVQGLHTSGNTLTETFSYTLRDLAGATSSALITLTVQGANDTPVALDDVGAASEAGGTLNAGVGSDATGNVLANDTDVDAFGETRAVVGVRAGQVPGPVTPVAGGGSAAVAGAYGTLTQNSDGTYTYVVDQGSAAVQALRPGETLADDFTYVLADGLGATDEGVLRINISGANDAPVAVDDAATAVEAGGVANGTAGSNATGNVLANDTDLDGTGSTVAAPGTRLGAYGSLVLNANGTYTYTVDNANAAVQALRTSVNTLTDTFSYTVVDASGATDLGELAITIEGRNDNPVAANNLAIALEAGGVANATPGANPAGNVLANDSDVDAGDTRQVLPAVQVGTYGTLTLLADGSASYALNNANGAVQGLRTSANTLTDTFTYSIVDGSGAGASAQIIVTIQGANDNPVALDDAGDAIEAGGVANGTAGSNATGNVLANDADVDAGDAKTVSGGVLAGTYGTLTLGADGSYTYVIDNSNAAVQALRTNAQTLSDTFSYTVADTLGATDLGELAITLHGRNDNPVAINNLAIARAAGVLPGIDPSGNVLANDIDVDAGDAKTVVTPGTFTGAYGSLTLNANGSYSYAVDNANAAVLALAPGGSLTEVFNYTMRDLDGAASSATLTVRIFGANNVPVASDDTASAIEAGAATAGTTGTGNVLTNDSDVDGGVLTVSAVRLGPEAGSGASGSLGAALAGAYGSLTLNSNGSYTYVIDNSNAAVQALRASGNTLSEFFTYAVADSAGASDEAQLLVTITGTNDAPVALDDAGEALEAGGAANATAGSPAIGNVLANDTDVDAGDSKTVSTSGTFTGTYGTLTLGADGSYTYVIDNSNAAVQALRTNAQTLTDTFSYTVADTLGATDLGQLAITLHGRNDNPVAAADTATALEAGGVANGTAGSNATGNVLANDTDADSIANGETEEVLSYAKGSTLGTLGAALAGTYGSLTLNADGTYTYAVDNNNAAVQALRTSGNTLTDAFSYTMADALDATSSSTLTITLTGANDAPVAIDDAGTAVEAGGVANGTTGSPATGNVLANDTDVDAGDSKTVSTSGTFTGAYGTLTLGADGSYTYAISDANAAVQALRTNAQTLTDTFSYTVADTLGATDLGQLAITLRGRNDNPMAAADSATAAEAGGVANGTAGSNATGNVLANDTDADSIANGETETVSAFAKGATAGTLGAALAGDFGSLTMNANGTYTYVVDNNNAAVQALRTSGNTLTDAFAYTMRDAAGATSSSTLTVTISGANDNPVGVDDGAVAVERGGLNNGSAGSDPTGNVLANDTDVDAGDTKTVATPGTFTGAYGSLLLNANGTYTYTVDNNNAAVQGLRTSGNTLADAFTYTVRDALGATAPATLTITIRGANDTPVAAADTAAALEAGGVANGTAGSNATGNVLANDTDVDAGDSKTVSTSGVLVGTYGSLTMNANGTYTYVVDNSNATVQALRTSGNTLTDAFAYTMRDTAGATSSSTLTVTISGVNDNPIGVNDAAVAVERGGLNNGGAGSDPTGNVLANDIDVDAGDGKTVATPGTFIGSYGTLGLNADGSYAYAVDNANAAVQALKPGESLADTFSYTLRDSAGATSSALITLTLQGANDTPVALDDVGAASEAGGTLNAGGGSDATGNVLGNDTDVDGGDSKTVSTPGVFVGAYGTLTLQSDGSYTYVVDQGSAAVQALRPGETLADEFTYGLADGLGATDEGVLRIDISGANDAPVAVDDAATAVEAGGVANGTAGSNATGNVLANDTDLDGTGSTVAAPGTRLGAYGSLVLNANGTYTYTVDNANAAVQALRTSVNTLTDTFSYTVVDASGASDLGELAITIEGRNDNPVAANNLAIALEAGGVANATPGANPAGNVLANDSDVDAGDTRQAVPTVQVGTYGTLTLLADGSASYALNNANGAVQALRTSANTLTDTFTYSIVDGAGAGASAQIIVTIQGANDNPVALDDAGDAIEAGGAANATPGSNATGNVLANDADVDAGDAKTVSGGVLAGTYGTLTLGADGSYTYVIDNANAAVQALRTNAQTLTDTFSYTVADTLGATDLGELVITLHGRNDNPVAINNLAIARAAGGLPGIDPSGNVLANDIDVDAGDAKTVVTPGTFTGAYGSLTLNANGSYSYAVDNANAAVLALAPGGSLSDLFNYTMRDLDGAASGAALTVRIFGANNVPVASDDTASAIEAGAATAGTTGTGNVLANDSDADAGVLTVSALRLGPEAGSGASGSVGAALTGAYGSLTLNANGSYTYVIDNANAAVQALRASANTLSEFFTYTVADPAGASDEAQLLVTITGTNDAPVALDDAGEALEAGGAANGSAGSPASGNVLANDTDVDLFGEGKSVSAGTFAGTFGTLTLAGSGDYTYVVNQAAVEALRVNAQTLTDTFSYTVADTLGATDLGQLVITVRGRNDNPVAAADSATALEAGDGTAGSPATGNVLANDTDVDSAANGETEEVLSYAKGATTGTLGAALAGTYGSLTLNANGTYTYAVDNSNAAVQALRTSGNTLSDAFSYTMADALGATSSSTLTVTISGANDAPVAIDDAGTALEAGGAANATAGSPASGNVLTNDTDVDAGDGKTVATPGTFAGAYGTLTIAGNGAYTYVVNEAAADALRVNEQTLTDTFAYMVRDLLGASDTGQLTITIRGRNDNPVAAADSATALEAGGAANGTPGSNATGNVLANDTDVDAGDSKTVSTPGVMVGAFGTLTLAANGSYTYVIDNSDAAVQALRTSGNTLADTFAYTMRDSAGATSSSTLTVTISGANDNPVALDDPNTAAEAGGTLNGTAGTDPTGNVLANDTDVDAGDGKTVVTPGTFAGAYGSLLLNANGTYAYTVDNANAVVQALKQGEGLVDTFSYSVRDTAGALDAGLLAITVRGAWDAPVAQDDAAFAVAANGSNPERNPSGSVFANDTDVDGGDTKTVVAPGTLVGAYGSLTLAIDGMASYDVDSTNPTVLGLGPLDFVIDTFTYQVGDAGGLTDTAQITVTVRGRNEDPAASDDSNTASDQTPAPQAAGNVLANDFDSDDAGNLRLVDVRDGTVVAGLYGTLTINADGSYTYQMDLANPVVLQAAGLGQVLHDDFIYAVSDPWGATDSAALVIHLDVAAPFIAPENSRSSLIAAGAAESTPGAFLAEVQPMLLSIDQVVSRNAILQQVSARETGGSRLQLTFHHGIQSTSIGEGLGEVKEQFVAGSLEQSRLASEVDLAWMLGRPGRTGLGADGLLSDPSPFVVDPAEMTRTAPGFQEQLKAAAQRRNGRGN